MELELRTRQVDLVDALRGYVQRRLRFKLSRHAGRVRRLKLRLTEESVANGRTNKLCVLAAELIPSGELLITETNTDLYIAIGRAIERLGSALHHKLERQRGARRGRDSVRSPGDQSAVSVLA
jgi:putative sigma-54 modulation protein